MEQKSLSITTIIQNKDVIRNETSSNPHPLLLFFFASLCSQTKLIDLDCRSPQLLLWRPRLHWCGRRKGPESCFTLPSPIHHCVTIFTITIADPPSWYHGGEVFQALNPPGKKSSPAPRSGQPVHRRGGEERWLATTLMCLEAIFRPYCMVWVTTD